MQIADLFAVDIDDLDTKKMVKYKMDVEHLDVSDALILLLYNTISVQHVKLHSYRHWGVNIYEDAKEVNPFLHMNSLVTMIYNYFGCTSFTHFFDTWYRAGLLSLDIMDRICLLMRKNMERIRMCKCLNLVTMLTGQMTFRSV